MKCVASPDAQPALALTAQHAVIRTVVSINDGYKWLRGNVTHIHVRDASTQPPILTPPDLFGKFPQNGDALLELGVGGGVADAEVAVPGGKDVSGDDKHVFIDRALHEFGSADFASSRNFGENIEARRRGG